MPVGCLYHDVELNVCLYFLQIAVESFSQNLGLPKHSKWSRTWTVPYIEMVFEQTERDWEETPHVHLGAR